MQNNISRTAPRDLMGETTGALVLTCFSTIWGLQGPRIMIFITPVVTIVLLVLCLMTRRAIQRLPQEKETPEAQTPGQKTSRRFGIIVIGEFAAIVVAVL